MMDHHHHRQLTLSINPKQAHLKKETAAKLKEVVPALTKDDLEVMQEVRKTPVL